MSLCRQFMSFIRRITTLWSFLTATALHISGKLLCTSTWCNSPPHILPRGGGGGGGVMSVWDKSTHAGPLNRLCTESRYLPFLIQFLLLNFHNWFIGSVKWSTLLRVNCFCKVFTEPTVCLSMDDTCTCIYVYIPYKKYLFSCTVHAPSRHGSPPIGCATSTCTCMYKTCYSTKHKQPEHTQLKKLCIIGNHDRLKTA